MRTGPHRIYEPPLGSSPCGPRSIAPRFNRSRTARRNSASMSCPLRVHPNNEATRAVSSSSSIALASVTRHSIANSSSDAAPPQRIGRSLDRGIHPRPWSVWPSDTRSRRIADDYIPCPESPHRRVERLSVPTTGPLDTEGILTLRRTTPRTPVPQRRRPLGPCDTNRRRGPCRISARSPRRARSDGPIWFSPFR